MICFSDSILAECREVLLDDIQPAVIPTFHSWMRGTPTGLFLSRAYCVAMIAETELRIIFKACESLDDFHRDRVGFGFRGRLSPSHFMNTSSARSSPTDFRGALNFLN